MVSWQKNSSSSPFRAAISHRFAERCVRRGYPTSPRFIFSGLTAHAHILHTQRFINLRLSAPFILMTPAWWNSLKRVKRLEIFTPDSTSHLSLVITQWGKKTRTINEQTKMEPSKLVRALKLPACIREKLNSYSGHDNHHLDRNGLRFSLVFPETFRYSISNYAANTYFYSLTYS